MTSISWILVAVALCTGAALAMDDNYDISVKIVTPKKNLKTFVKSFSTVSGWPMAIGTSVAAVVAAIQPSNIKDQGYNMVQ